MIQPDKCTICGDNGTTRRQLTKYADDAKNFDTLCAGHQEVADDHYREAWRVRHDETNERGYLDGARGYGNLAAQRAVIAYLETRG